MKDIRENVRDKANKINQKERSLCFEKINSEYH